MVSNGPYAVEGWDGFLDDEDEVWLEAFETTENGQIDLSAYDEFENMQEVVNFVAGTGSYSDNNSFGLNEEDMDMRKRQMHNDRWKIPERLRRIEDLIRDGSAYSEIDLDPSAKTAWQVNESDARMDNRDTKYTAHFTAYSSDDDGASVYFAFSWYDREPSSMNLEEEIDMDDIDELLED